MKTPPSPPSFSFLCKHNCCECCCFQNDGCEKGKKHCGQCGYLDLAISNDKIVFILDQFKPYRVLQTSTGSHGQNYKICHQYFYRIILGKLMSISFSWSYLCKIEGKFTFNINTLTQKHDSSVAVPGWAGVWVRNCMKLTGVRIFLRRLRFPRETLQNKQYKTSLVFIKIYKNKLPESVLYLN